MATDDSQAIADDDVLMEHEQPEQVYDDDQKESATNQLMDIVQDETAEALALQEKEEQERISREKKVQDILDLAQDYKNKARPMF